ncbi:MAG: FkbM family methyltransferase [Oscillospiraceae bacterium]|nr:FkbM family methyltransferase [Oscillospiraceae bacterium]
MLSRFKNWLKRWLPPTSKSFYQAMNRLQREYERHLSHIDHQLNALTSHIDHQLNTLNQQLASVQKCEEMLIEVNREITTQLETLSEQLMKMCEQETAVAQEQNALFGDLRLQSDLGMKVSEDIKERLEEIVQTQAQNEAAIQKQQASLLSEVRVCRRNSTARYIYTNLTEREALAESFAEIMQDSPAFERKFQKLIRGLDTQSRQNVIRILSRMHKILDRNTKGIDLFTEQEQEELRKMKDDFSAQILQVSDQMYCYNGYLLPVNQFDASVFYSRYGLELVEGLERIRQGDIIDAGGYVGDTALLFSSLTSKNVYVFEAAPDNYDLVQKTVALNGLTNVVAENLALGAERCTMTFSLGERNSCNTLIERPGYVYPEHIDVQVVSLDEYVREHNLKVGLIKVDVEGGEQLVLKGALETIRRFKPVLLFSIYHSASDFFDIKPMIEELGLGYKFKVFKPINNAIAIETVLIAE